MRARRKLALGLLAGALILSSQNPALATSGPACRLPWLPVKYRVADLMSRMTLDDKLGQMMQPERLGITDINDLATYRIGSLLSGGSSQPTPNTPVAWADMYDNFQRAALQSPLQIPLIYGVDAVHGHNGVYGATVFPHNIGLGATRDPGLVRDIGEAISGRPLGIAAQLPDWKGLIAAWLPGTEGNGVSDVLFGDYNPTGKLPVTWMQSASQQPINAGDGKPALFPLGYGLRYRH